MCVAIMAPPGAIPHIPCKSAVKGTILAPFWELYFGLQVTAIGSQVYIALTLCIWYPKGALVVSFLFGEAKIAPERELYAQQLI